jgi:hypothetical protein
MAFPTVDATATDGSATDQTGNHSVNIPAGNVADALLIAIFGNDGSAVVSGWPSGWTTLVASTNNGATHRYEVRYKVSLGTETNCNLTTSAVESSASVTFLIKGWDKNTAPAAGSTITATTQTPNPPSLDPAGWATEDTLWIAVQSWDDGRTAADTAPTNYSGLTSARPNTAAGGCGAAMAWRQNAAASEDPGTFGNSASDPAMANTLAALPWRWARPSCW